MADERQLERLRNGAKAWNDWWTEERSADIRPDLTGANLRETNLRQANLSRADLSEAKLSKADLSEANLDEANLRQACLILANLSGTHFRGAYFQAADLCNANLRGADLSTAHLPGANIVGANLSGANLRGADLHGARLRGADLSRAELCSATLSGADLQGANLDGADLSRADLSGAQLTRASLQGAVLCEANLERGILRGADLKSANLHETNLTRGDLSGADLSDANVAKTVFNETIFSDTKLRHARGLDLCMHTGPSVIDFRTLTRCGSLPLPFLRGCGLPEKLIAYLPSLLNEPIQFYSCFISYSTADQTFAERLHADLQNNGVRCWYAPHHVQGGQKLHEQIDEAIRLHDRVLLILSGTSINSEWVRTEVAKARKREMLEKRRVLFPVRLIDFDRLRCWECFDADIGKDSAREIREYFIPDFSKWKDHDSYQQAFQHLLHDLEATARPRARA